MTTVVIIIKWPGWFYFCDRSLIFLPCPRLLLMSESEGCCLLTSACREKNATAGRDVVCVQLPTQPGCWVTDLIFGEHPFPVVAGGEAVVFSAGGVLSECFHHQTT